MRLTVQLLKKTISIPLEYQTHRQRVKSLYKKAIRNLEAWVYDLPETRYEAVLLRHRFDENKHLTDVVEIRKIMNDAEKELFENWHPKQIKFPEAPGGVAYEREHPTPDWVLDYWHPLEKAAYPEYFKRREERKKEFVVWWEKQYGKPNPDDAAH